MKRAIGILLGLALLAGAGLAFGRGGGGGGHGGGGGRGGGAHMSGGSSGHAGVVGTRTGMNGGFTRFTTGPTRFTTGPHPGRPIVGVRPPIGVRPGFPPHRVIVGGGVVVAGPYFWYPPYPYPYPYPGYAYETPAYGGPAYSSAPTYIEQGAISYYCPDYQDYYPNVPTCPSPWMQVIPEAPPATSN
jgi:hypothetical protein